MSADDVANRAGDWRCKLAGGVSVVLGVMLVLMGGGHLCAVVSVALAKGKPLDYRLVSLIATGGIVAYPGLLGVSISRWIWQGRDWAYAMSVASAAATSIYLVLVLIAEVQDPAGFPSVGRELDLATLIVGAYFVVLIAVWASFRIGRRRRLSP